jgi:catechol-2,3-dioxygenase
VESKSSSDSHLVWPARLHHFALTSEAPDVLADWYRAALNMEAERFGDSWHMSGPARHLLIEKGPNNGVKFAAYGMTDDAAVEALVTHIRKQGSTVDRFETPLFDGNAFSIPDPDGNIFVFGSSNGAGVGEEILPARLQHIVFTTTQFAEQIKFYTDVVGFRKSDIVLDDDRHPTACFMRSDSEHHSLGMFRAAAQRLDHFCFESSCWNDIRDWGDHFSEQRIPIVWGAGRHGAGNNLFIFVEDPDGNKVEISAEIELMSWDQDHREWPHEERTLNLWGTAWLRS